MKEFGVDRGWIFEDKMTNAIKVLFSSQDMAFSSIYYVSDVSVLSLIANLQLGGPALQFGVCCLHISLGSRAS
jgi:hypothetical protein